MNRFPPIPQSSISSRRKSQSPTRVSQSPSVVAEKIKDKENIAPDQNLNTFAATTPATKSTIESPSSEGRKKESRKKRKSLNRRVSFSQTVDVRTFIKGDDWKNASPEEKEKQEEKPQNEVTATPITKLVAPVQPDETLFDLPEDTLSANVADTLMVTEEDTATFQGTDSVLKDFMAKSPLKKVASLPDQFPSPEPVATTITMPMEVEESDIEKLEKKRSLRKSRNSFSPTQASLHEFLHNLQDEDNDSNTITMDAASNPTLAKILANLRGESAESPAVNRSSRRRSSGVMKTPDLKRFITDIEPEDSVIAHSPSEFLAQLSKQQQQNYDDEQESPDSPISEFNLEDTINQPTFMRTPSISKLLKDTALPDEPSTITMTQDQVTSMLTPSLARLLSKTRRESTDGPAPRESLSGMTFMKTPTLSKLLSKTDFEDSPISPLNMEDTVSQATFMRTPNLQKLLSKTAPDSVEKNSASKTPNMKKFLLDAETDDSLTLSPSEFQGEVSMTKSPAKSPARLLPKASPLRSAVVQSPARSRRSLAESTPQKPAESPARKNSLIHRLLALSPGKEQQTVDILALTRNQISSPELEQRLKDYELEQLLAQPVGVKEFLYHYDLNFLDDVSDRRPSVLCPPVQRTFVSAREKVQMGATKSAEKAVFEWGCDELNGINASIIEEVKAAEEFLAANNPSIFKSIHLAESTQEIKAQLKQMKSICKKEAKESWYEWRVRLEKSYTERLVDNFELLRNDHQKLVEMIDEVTDLRGAMKDDVKNFLATKGVKDVPSDGDDLTIFVTPTAKEDVEMSHSKQEIVRILSSLLPYKVQTLSPAEIVLHINEQFVLHMVYDRETNKITHKAIAPLTGARVDRFTEALVESANINSVLANLESLSQLREILNEISFRLGRVADLQKELAQLNRSFTVRCKKVTSEPGGQVEIEFPNMEKCSKFSMTFDVQYSYPCGPLPFTVKTLFGEVSQESIHKIVKNVPARFGRLTNICRAIKQL